MGLIAQVESIIEDTIDATQKAMLRNYWEYSPVLVQGLGLTEVRLDDLFTKQLKFRELVWM